jgi:hypothetical protein
LHSRLRPPELEQLRLEELLLQLLLDDDKPREFVEQSVPRMLLLVHVQVVDG